MAGPNECWVALTAANGHRLEAFTVTPASPRGSVVVLQEIFGVNGHIQAVARQVAALGYQAVTPALFDQVRPKVSLSYDKAGIEEGKALIAHISQQTAMSDVAAAVAYASASGPVAVLGFCWGGSLAWIAAYELPIAGAVAYYGGQIGALLEKAPKHPVMTHFGDADASISPEVSASVSERFPAVVNHRYSAGHGFNCNERPAFDPASAALAWQRTSGFLTAVM